MDLVAAPGLRGVGARRGATLFCDMTVASPVSGDGVPRSGAHLRDGAVVGEAVARHQTTYADVTGGAALVVLGMELFGRWSEDAEALIKELSYLKARESPPLLRRSAEQAWSRRWWSMASVGCHRAIAAALLCSHAVDLLPNAPVSAAPRFSEI